MQNRAGLIFHDPADADRRRLPRQQGKFWNLGWFVGISTGIFAFFFEVEFRRDLQIKRCDGMSAARPADPVDHDLDQGRWRC